MGKKIVAGNWKMNKNIQETVALIEDLKKETQTSDARVIIFPSFVCLATASEAVKGSAIEVGAQNMSRLDSGARTGAVSADMIKSAGVNIVLLGHSERRNLYGESTKIIHQKVDTAVEDGMEIVFCCGEKLKHRKNDEHFFKVENQIVQALFHLDEQAFDKIIIAYEPVWAIGTGQTATAKQVQEMHIFIRKLIEEQYSKETADKVSILYGGSVKPTNAKELFSMPDVDGGLIGGASLNAADFFGIVNAY